VVKPEDDGMVVKSSNDGVFFWLRVAVISKTSAYVIIQLDWIISHLRLI
jgi:hypothetical protein